MSKNSNKKNITISVEPQIATLTLGLLRGFLPSILEHMTTTAKQMDILINDEHLLEEMQEILNEIYEKCIAQTDIRKRTIDFIEMLELTGGIFPTNKEC